MLIEYPARGAASSSDGKRYRLYCIEKNHHSHRGSSMVENPMLPEWVNGGFMVFSKSIFDWLSPDDPLEAGALRRLAKAGELMAYRHEGFWACMDTYKDNLRLNELWNSGQAKWKKW
jgi:NDP-sugar pyrophosphorylase family protein